MRRLRKMAKKPLGDEKVSREEFLEIPTAEVRRLVLKKRKPHTGIFVSDGNRRLVMIKTGLTPKSEDFYPAYVRIFAESFMENLTVFFNHGLKTLFFPLLGPSLLKRCDRYRQYVIPELVRTLFQGKSWISFYKKYGIRVKAYGNLNILNREFPGMDLEETIMQREVCTSTHQKHTLFYGFFSSGIFEAAFINKVNHFIKTHLREPNHQECAEMYYGEPIVPADFFITSTRSGYLGALPSWVYGKGTHMYTLASPGVFGLNKITYREILYDLLFLRPNEDNRNLDDINEKDIKSLEGFYQLHQNKVIGTGKTVGKWWVLND